MLKKIIFLSSYDPESSASWSGTPKFMLNALKQRGIEVVIIGPVKSYTIYFLKLYKCLIKFLFKKEYDYSHSKILSYEYSILFQFRLKHHLDGDFIIAPAGSTQIAMLATKIPIYYVSDTTFGQMENYYANFNNLDRKSIVNGNEIELLALNKASLISFPSKWASDFAKSHYQIPSEKIKPILWGANISNPPPMSNKSISGKKKFKCLLLGVDWDRKGCNIAIEAVKLVREKGVDVQLIICGCTPVRQHLPEWVNLTGQLSKDIPKEYNLLCDLLMETDVLVLPTKAECYGMVFCEAAAYATPTITTNTGGIPSIVDNETGYLIESPYDSVAFGSALFNLLSNPELFNAMSICARKKYEEKLNWNSWAIRVLENMNEFLQKK